MVCFMRRIFSKLAFTIYAMSVLVVCNSAYAQDQAPAFCPEGDAPLYLHAVFPVIKNANIKDFVETNELNRFGTIATLADLGNSIAASMSSSEAKPIKELLSFYDEFYGYMVKNSDQGVDGYISSKILSELEALHYLEQIPKRRLVVTRTDTLPEDVFRYTMIGSYSYLNDGRVALNVVVRNIKTGEQRAFAASGKLSNATKDIARAIFDLFYLPQPPRFLNPFADSELIEIKSGLYKNRVEASFADQICAAQNARVPSKQELRLATALGKYVTGVEVSTSDFYVINDTDKGLMRFQPATGECHKLDDRAKTSARLICIRDK